MAICFYEAVFKTMTTPCPFALDPFARGDLRGAHGVGNHAIGDCH